jgi:DNA-directed RNA polymerase beta subunit/DNA-directed RNA polymerase beta' subunit
MTDTVPPNTGLDQQLAPAIIATIRKAFPIRSQDGARTVEVRDVTIDPKAGFVQKLNAHQKARELGGTLSTPIKATLDLVENGKVVETFKGKIGDMPLQTRFGTFMVGGNDYYTPAAQLRLKPGAYTREKENGELEVFLPTKGSNIRIWMEPSKGVLKLGHYTTNVSWYSIVKALGATDDEVKIALGSADMLSRQQKAAKYDRDVDKLFRSVFDRKIDVNLIKSRLVEGTSAGDGLDNAAKAAALQSWFPTNAVDPFVMRKTMGKPYENLDKDVLLRAAQRMLAVYRKDEQGDDRDSPEFKSAHTTADLMVERFERLLPMIVRTAVKNLGKPGAKLRQVIEPDWVNVGTVGYFGGMRGVEGGMAHTAEAANPLAILSDGTKMTLLGEGGIGDTHAITNAARLFRPIASGYIDPSHTPEGSAIGVATHIAHGASVQDKSLTSSMYRVTGGIADTKNRVRVKIEDASDAVIGYPEYWDMKTGKPLEDPVRAVKGGDIAMVPPKEVAYVIPSGSAMFDPVSAAAIFLHSTHPNRAMMAGKHLTQALPLIRREKSAVELLHTSTPGQDPVNMHAALASPFVLRSPVDGTVKEVTPTHITIDDTRVELYDNYPMQAKVAINHEPRVKVGDVVKKGQLLADSNYTKDGQLALGVNLRSAYMPWRGASNFEDAVVISESASKKLASEHMHREYFSLKDDAITVDKKLFAAQFPTKAPIKQLEKLDDSGIIKEGVEVHTGDLLVAAVRKQEFDKDDRSAKNLASIHKMLLRPYKSAELTWDEEYVGTVIRVNKLKTHIEIHIRTEEEMRVGDKVSMSSAAKGTVSQVVADHEMPHDEKGRHIEIVFNPHGVAGRINPSQTLEQAAGKLVIDGGGTYKHENFDGRDHAVEIKQALEEKGLKHAEILTDPVTGKKLERPVAVGYNYVFKLDHPVRKKFSARGKESYTLDETPTVGKGKGGQSYDHLTTYALLGHDAHAILGESYGQRGFKNDEFWHAYQAGETPPPPKTPFVFKRFEALLNASGVDTKRDGTTMHFLPLTDKAILERSKGEITSPHKVRAKDLAEERGGLFDPKITGGLKGEDWGHITLGRAMPHPMYEKVIRDLTDIKQAEFIGLLAGTLFLQPNGKVTEEHTQQSLTGEAAFKKLLSFDVGLKKSQLEAEVRTATGSDKNRAYRALRYLQGLEKSGLSPSEAYLTSMVPVIPPRFRPLVEQNDGSVRDDAANTLYRDLVMTKQLLQNAEKDGTLSTRDKGRARAALYDAHSALIGIGKPLTKGRDEELRGFVEVIKGKSNKEGLFQRMVTRRRNDFSARSTIEPDADLAADEIGLPEEMAWKIYEPQVARRMVKNGWSPADANKQVKDRTLAARQALEAELKDRPVLYNRAPSLHRWSVLAAYPKLHAGKHIGLSPLVIDPLGADFDGNCTIGDSLLTLTIAGSALEQGPKENPMRTVGTTLFTTKDGDRVFEAKIKDVPLGPKVATDRNGADVYAAPEGLHVLTTGLDGQGARFSPVHGITVEDGCGLRRVQTTTRKFSVVVSDNESLATYNPVFGTLDKTRPDDAVGLLVPYVSSIPVPLGQQSDRDLGWAIGAFVGDGFLMRTGYFGFTKLDDSLRKHFESVVVDLFGVRRCGEVYRDEANDNKLGPSAKVHFSVGDGDIRVFRRCYVDIESANEAGLALARAALNKQLPDLEWTVHMAVGALAGLLDSDGSICVVQAKAKTKPQIQIQFSTSSPFLRDGVIRLCRLLNIRASFSTTMPSETRLQRHPSFTLSISSVDIASVHATLNIPVQTARYRDILENLISSEFRDDRDVVPVPSGLWAVTRDKTEWTDQKLLATLRTKRTCKDGTPSMSRSTARRTLEQLQHTHHATTEWFQRWEALVADDSTKWDRVESAIPQNTERVYDFIVPDTQVFAVNGGLIIYDTIAVHAPITDKAKEESKQLLPKNNLFYDKDRSIVFAPGKDVIVGLFALTRTGVASGKEYASESAAITAYENNQDGLQMNSIVKVDGVPGVPTIGWLIFKTLVPERFLTGIQPPINKKRLNEILERVARTDPQSYSKISRALAVAGFEYAARAGGVTATVDELAMDRTKVKKLLTQFAKELEGVHDKDKKSALALDLFNNKYKKELDTMLQTHLDQHPVGYRDIVESGSSSKANLDNFRQLFMSPVLVQDVHDKVVPSVVTTGYAGGIRPSDFVMTTPGARAGLVARSLSTALPGFLAKEIAGNMSGVRVSETDCGTHHGLDMPLSNKNLKDYDVDLLDRHLAAPVGKYKYNDVVTPAMLADLRATGVQTFKVRSPMTCEATKPPCSMCAGRAPDGRVYAVGSNIGYNYGQSVSERSTQLTMRAFHSGGTVGAGHSLMAGFQRLRELLAAPDIVREQGTIAMKSGTVKEVRKAPQGGWYVDIKDATDDEVHEHYVQPGRTVKVEAGARVAAGDEVSDGSYRPQDLADTKGLLHAQKYVVEQARKAYQDAGAVVRMPVIEVVAAGMMRYVEITDSAGESGIHVGSVMGENEFKLLQKRNPKVQARPTILGLSQKPIVTSHDLFERLNFQRLDDALREAPATGSTSDLTGSTSPLPGLAYGAHFRQNERPTR